MSKKPDNQIAAMITDYKAGKTLAEIGNTYGVSRQRIHQIFKREGVSSEGNGSHARTRARETAAAKARAARIMKSWGFTVQEYEAHVAEFGSSTNYDSPMRKYIDQRRNSERQGVEWKFTFKSWWAMWVESGKWNERGRGQYVLGREGNASTPMSPNTCRISTVSDIICGDFFSRGKAHRKDKPTPQTTA